MHKQHRVHSFQILLLCAMAWLSPAALAALDQIQIQWHGFANVGGYYTDRDGYLNDEKGTQAPLLDIGVGGFLPITQKLLVSAQLLYRQAGESSRDDIFLDYGFVDWRAIESGANAAGVRIGRVKNIYGLYNDVRDVASLRPSIFLPDAIYKEKFRDFYHTSDAVSVYWYKDFTGLALSLDASLGKLNISDQAARELLPPGAPAHLDDERSLIARALADLLQGQLRLAYSYADLSYDMEADSSRMPEPLSGEAAFLFQTYSAELFVANWTFTAEKTHTKVSLENDVAPEGNSVIRPSGYYLSAQWEINPTWRVFARYESFTQKNPQTHAHDHSQFARDRAIGATFRGQSNWQVSLEYHRVHGSAWLSNQSEGNDNHAPWNLYAMQFQTWF